MMLNGAWPTQTNIGRVLRDIGQYGSALSKCEEALEGLQEQLGKDHPSVIAAEFCRGTIFELQGRFREALDLYVEIASKEEQSGPDHLETLKMKCFIGSVTAKLGRYEAARQLYEQVEKKLPELPELPKLPNLPDCLGPGHLVKLMVSHGKADILEQRGQYDGALVLYKDVCSTWEKSRLKKHPEHYRAVHGKGKVYIQMGEYEVGQKFLKDAIDGWTAIFNGPDHPLIFMALEDQGNALLQRGALCEAQALCRQALDGCEKMLGDRHPQTCRAKASLSAVLSKQGLWEEASERCREALRGLQVELGNEHLWTLGTMRILAGIMWGRYRYWEACRLSIAAEAGRRKVLAAPSREGAIFVWLLRQYAVVAWLGVALAVLL
jgi:tetratricopeptide (TPR) repeat protein